MPKNGPGKAWSPQHVQTYQKIIANGFATIEPLYKLCLWYSFLAKPLHMPPQDSKEPLTAGTGTPVSRSLLVRDVPGKAWVQIASILVLDMLKMCRVDPDVLTVPLVVRVTRVMEKLELRGIRHGDVQHVVGNFMSDAPGGIILGCMDQNVHGHSPHRNHFVLHLDLCMEAAPTSTLAKPGVAAAAWWHISCT